MAVGSQLAEVVSAPRHATVLVPGHDARRGPALVARLVPQWAHKNIKPQSGNHIGAHAAIVTWPARAHRSANATLRVGVVRDGQQQVGAEPQEPGHQLDGARPVDRGATGQVGGRVGAARDYRACLLMVAKRKAPTDNEMSRLLTTK